MPANFRHAFMAGVERVSAWADLLDRVNVFPVADGDTGRNLVISLSPLRHPDRSADQTARDLLLSARGNSGNIAAHFFSRFLAAESLSALASCAVQGRDRAWKAVANPQEGTILSLFDGLAEALKNAAETEDPASWIDDVLSRLEAVVRKTPDQQAKLKRAGVVDSGALGMFIFFEGFFHTFTGRTEPIRPVTETFREGLTISPAFLEETEAGYCVDTVLHGGGYSEEAVRTISGLGDSVTVTGDGRYLKIHLHTENEEDTRRKLAPFGDLVRWSADDLGAQIRAFRQTRAPQAIHIMTDAAGSVTRSDARQYGLTLLDSYITIGDRCLPETFFQPESVYGDMGKGVKASTSQASVFERHQHYQAVLEMYDRVLYLCVGSVFTGNYETAMAWKKTHDRDNRLTVIDTGAASGRLGLMAIAAARQAFSVGDPEDVIAFANGLVQQCDEVIFPESLRYLAAGGRLSKTGAFFGDMLHLKPVISPTAEGAKKVGMVRNQPEQIRFALEKIGKSIPSGSRPLIMLEYSDNLPWVRNTVRPEMERHFPDAEIILQPLSLTTGVHTGPGAWAAAFLPVI